ncbi:ATP-binding protein [Mycobacterium simulans]|uniref:ATP-binding protein n=1 Tax=Mycobacterium simulans TaxID=627089 RepID=UPI001CD3BCC5|nr:hypothetical protein [Mycobacterium simulans]
MAEICRRVDCLPLGVELAAARMRMMSTSDMVRRLDGLGMLRGGMRSSLPRHQSLTATIEWSYRMLTESEQALFARLSVFAGSFDLDAVHGVYGADDGRGVEAVDALEDTLESLVGLVDKSMVVVRSVTDRTRYGVLVTLRAYGRDRLKEQGIDKQVAKRHAVYFTELAERAGIGLHTAEERAWVERMLPDYDNLRTAFEHAMADNDTDLALRMVAAGAEVLGVRVGWLLLLTGTFLAAVPCVLPIPETCWPTWLFLRVTRAAFWRTGRRRWPVHVATPTRSGWCTRSASWLPVR